MNPFKTINKGDGYVIELHVDSDPENPRQWDNMGEMVCFHKRYDLGDKDHGFTPETLLEYVKDPNVVSLPLYLMDHSGLTMRHPPHSIPSRMRRVPRPFRRRSRTRFPE